MSTFHTPHHPPAGEGQAGYDFQRYVVENMMSTSVSSYGFLQAARTYVKGYENLHGYKLRFETTWLDKP
jgi:hypothetical protein